MLTKQIFTFGLFLLVGFYMGNAQDPIRKHTVASNETITTIAQYYDVTVEDIQKLNPGIVNGIKESDVLIIPITGNSENLNQGQTKYVVKAGDTKFSLAKRFGMTIADLENQNPHIVPMLKVGEILYIGSNLESANHSENSTGYVVKSGDTKFGLAKKFGISIEQLEKMNPQIVPTLMVGQTLSFSDGPINPEETNAAISVTSNNEELEDQEKQLMDKLEINSNEIHQKNSISETSQSEQQATLYFSHTIQPGETLYGLSKAAGMSMEAFLDLNPKLSTSVQAGMVIKMPTANGQIKNESLAIHSGNVKSISTYTDLKQTLITDKEKKLTFFLPFTEKKFEQAKMVNLNEYVNNNSDFFSGAMIAIDSAKALGLKINFDIINLGTTNLSSEQVEIVENANVNSSDAIILPYYQKSVQDLAFVATKYNVPVVTATSPSIKKKASNLYEAVPSANAQRKTILEYLSSKNDGNLIVLNDENRSESRDFISANSPEAKFVQVKENGVFNSQELVGMLQKNSRNYVILDTDKNGVFISATNALLRELSNYQIQLVVLESSLIPDEDDVSRKRFVILEMLYPSFTNVNSDGKRRFREHYKKLYSIEPTTSSFYGFDITFDTLLRLFQPENFEQVSKKITEYNRLKFKYSKNEWGYYSNFGVGVFQYETQDFHKQVK